MQTVDDLRHSCSAWSDQKLLDQYRLGPEASASSAHYAVLAEEIERRSLDPRTGVHATNAPVPVAPYALRLWRGQISLPVTYWVWGIGGKVVFRFAGRAMGEAPMLLLLPFVAVAATYEIVILVAVWRSAGNHPGSPVWAALARLAVVVGVLLAFRRLW